MEAAGLVSRGRNPDDEWQVLLALACAAHVPGCLVEKLGGQLDELAALRDRLARLTRDLRAGYQSGA